ncbi:MAG: FAD-binding oxidoreductase [Dehalococcoidia bacterium]|nr:FAD-binding oxidoreductase [Dehalococcoidia bacterium]
MIPHPDWRVLHGWGGTAPAGARLVRTGTPEAVRTALVTAERRRVIARGLGRSYGDAAQVAGGDVLALAALTGAVRLDAEAGTVTAPSGARLGALLRLLMPRGWMLPVLPGTAHVTVGGAIAADVHGKSHHRDGSFGAHVNSLTLLTPDGTAHHLSRSEDAEAFHTTLGGMGLTGVVTEATLRLERIASTYVVARAQVTTDLDGTMHALASADAAHRWSVAWLDLTGGCASLGRGIVEHADPAPLEVLPPRALARPLAPRRARQLGVPPLPVSVVNRVTVRALNEARYALAQRAPNASIRHIEAYLFPLDVLDAWPRLYGPHGFLQYQFIVPFGAEATLHEVVRRVAAGPVPVALAVLKRFGASEGGPLSFPQRGWTLTLDLPAARPEVLGPLLDGCDDLVAAAGGRIYLAKDARMRADVVPAMYPRLAEWQAVRNRLDPEGRMTSDLDRRLNLSGRHG